jgi:hypothetical protein
VNFILVAEVVVSSLAKEIGESGGTSCIYPPFPS